MELTSEVHGSGLGPVCPSLFSKKFFVKPTATLVEITKVHSRYFQASHGLAWPDWVNNGTTYKDLRTVANFGMYWNFNTREKARLTGGMS